MPALQRSSGQEYPSYRWSKKTMVGALLPVRHSRAGAAKADAAPARFPLNPPVPHHCRRDALSPLPSVVAPWPAVDPVSEPVLILPLHLFLSCLCTCSYPVSMLPFMRLPSAVAGFVVVLRAANHLCLTAIIFCLCPFSSIGSAARCGRPHDHSGLRAIKKSLRRGCGGSHFLQKGVPPRKLLPASHY